MVLIDMQLRLLNYSLVNKLGFPDARGLIFFVLMKIIQLIHFQV